MATKAQIAANRANSKKSTGPTTADGKAKSSLNRLSHGFTSVTRMIDGEDPEEFKALHLTLLDELHPATTVETILVEKMSINQWLSLRALRLQVEAFQRQENPMVDGDIPKDLALLIRYQTSADRAFHKAHAELLKAQKERKKLEIGFVPQNREEEHQPAPEPPSPQPTVRGTHPDTTPSRASEPLTAVNAGLAPANQEEKRAAHLGITVEELRRAA